MTIKFKCYIGSKIVIIFVTFLFISLSAVADYSNTQTYFETRGEIIAETKQAIKEHGKLVNLFKKDIIEQLSEYPDLSVEEAFCIVSRGLNPDLESSNRCLHILKIKVDKILRKFYYSEYGIPIMTESNKGSFNYSIDEDGLPEIELTNEGIKFWKNNFPNYPLKNNK